MEINKEKREIEKLSGVCAFLPKAHFPQKATDVSSPADRSHSGTSGEGSEKKKTDLWEERNLNGDWTNATEATAQHPEQRFSLLAQIQDFLEK